MKKIFFLLLFIPIFFNLLSIDKHYSDKINKLINHSVKTISPSELLKMMNNNNNIYLLDTREPEEFNTSHINNAINVGFKKFKIENIKSIPHNKIIVLYCSVGYRSEKIGEILLKNNYINVFNLYGGIFEWINQGYNVYDVNGKTNKIHGYSKKWSKWLKNGEIIYNN